MATRSRKTAAARAKTAAKKPTAKKATKKAAKKAATKAPARKAAAKKPVAKKVARKSTAKKAPARKAAAKKAAPRKAAAKKAAPKRVAAKKVPAKKAAPKRAAAPRKAAPRRAVPRAVGRGAPVAAGAGAPVAPSMPADFFSGYTGEAITPQDFADAAQALGCEVAAIKAVAEVETKGAAFDSSRRPTILYERHLFARHTVPPGKFNASHPDLSATKGYGPGGYGTMAQQYPKLARAYQLDANAALMAPSWGKFQILGENHRACGFATAADYVKAMCISEREHLKAFCKFVAANPAMHQALKAKDWAGFARRYNGPQYAQFQYDRKMAAAYAKHSA